MKSRRLGIFWMLWGLLLTVVTYFLGAAPLRAVRRQMGRLFFWGGVLLISSILAAGLWFQSVDSSMPYVFILCSFLSVALLIGLFVEFEESGLSLDVSAAFSLLILSFLTLGSVGIAYSIHGIKLLEMIKSPIDQMIKSTQLDIPVNQVLVQAPSALVILWMIAIYVSVLFESRIRLGPKGQSSYRSELLQFRAPGWIVWTFIGSVALAFGGLPQYVEVIALNVLNLSIAVFFFQGLSILHQILLSLRVGLFWQAIFVTFLVVQLFIFVSCLGLADYWLDIRSRLMKWRQSRLETFNRREK